MRVRSHCSPGRWPGCAAAEARRKADAQRVGPYTAAELRALTAANPTPEAFVRQVAERRARDGIWDGRSPRTPAIVAAARRRQATQLARVQRPLQVSQDTVTTPQRFRAELAARRAKDREHWPSLQACRSLAAMPGECDPGAMPQTREVYEYDTLHAFQIEETDRPGTLVFAGVTDNPVTYVGEFSSLIDLWNRLGDDRWVIADAPWVQVKGNLVGEPAVWDALVHGRKWAGKHVGKIHYHAKHRMSRRSHTLDSEPAGDPPPAV